ncbi:heme exporter protein CcmD [Sphingomonas metalli]|nr:heme exporter protein CcmD [Sphingomonas metalli]
MNPWPFVLAAYGVTLAGFGVLALLSWRAMRRAERP